jgi:arylsulfatase A
VPLLRDPKASLARDTLYFHYPHYYNTTTPVSAIHRGDWKLLEYYEDGKTELYNLTDDPREQQDLAQQKTDKATELKQQLHAWLKEVNAQLPELNPNFVPGKTKKNKK